MHCKLVAVGAGPTLLLPNLEKDTSLLPELSSVSQFQSTLRRYLT